MTTLKEATAALHRSRFTRRQANRIVRLDDRGEAMLTATRIAPYDEKARQRIARDIFDLRTFRYNPYRIADAKVMAKYRQEVSK